MGYGPVWDCSCWLNKLLLLCGCNKLIKKVAWCLVNCVVAIAVNLKSNAHVFGKFYYKFVILSYDDQNTYKFKFFF